MVDPSHLEAVLLPSTLHVALTHLGSSSSPTLCVLQKAGGIEMSFEEITACIDIGVQRARGLAEWLNKEIGEDWERRKAFIEVQ